MNKVKITLHRIINGESEKYTAKYNTETKEMILHERKTRGFIYGLVIGLGNIEKSEIIDLATVLREIGEEIWKNSFFLLQHLSY